MGPGKLMRSNRKMLVGGKLVHGDRALDVVDPSMGETIAEVGCASEAQADEALRAARAAQPGWAAEPWGMRARLLLRFADGIRARAAELAELLVREQGKPLAEAQGEGAYAEGYVRHFAGLTLPTETLRDGPGGRVELRRRPLGVVLAIAPWNFPLLIPAYKIAPAVLAGNAVVLKAAGTAPLSALALAGIAADLFPPGVVNVVVDRNDLGPYLTGHPEVDKISFTGSTAVGREVAAAGANGLKRLVLELGGNDAAIVLDDVDVERTADAIVDAAFYNAGQGCLVVKRAYVADRVHDAFCERAAARAGAIRIGGGLDPRTGMGPVQNERQFEKARRFLEIARRDGTVLVGGETPPGSGYFVQPTVVRDVEDGSPLVDEEQFCPVLPIVRMTRTEDALAAVNRGDYGLAGSVWSGDPAAARAVGERMATGTVWINQHLNVGPDVPTAGARRSGLGVEWGALGLAEFTQVNVINQAPIA